MTTVRIGTRKSRLARWQTDHVATLLAGAHPGIRCEIITFETEGDRNIAQPLPEIGGKGLFTEALERALHEGTIDLAVHSLKDLPTDQPDGLMVGAVPEREDPRDTLVAGTDTAVATLATGSRVGTSSVRRAAQLRALRPDLEIASIRGNVDTRVRKAVEGEYDAVILAAAGLKRLALDHHVREFLPPDQMVPAPGQGALAVQCRAECRTAELLHVLDDGSTRAAVTAERAVLAGLGGGCSAPIAAHATVDDTSIHLTALVAATDGSRVVRVTADGLIGHLEAVAHRAVTELHEQGAGDLL